MHVAQLWWSWWSSTGPRLPRFPHLPRKTHVYPQQHPINPEVCGRAVLSHRFFHLALAFLAYPFPLPKIITSWGFSVGKTTGELNVNRLWCGDVFAFLPALCGLYLFIYLFLRLFLSSLGAPVRLSQTVVFSFLYHKHFRPVAAPSLAVPYSCTTQHPILQ